MEDGLSKALVVSQSTSYEREIDGGNSMLTGLCKPITQNHLIIFGNPFLGPEISA